MTSHDLPAEGARRAEPCALPHRRALMRCLGAALLAPLAPRGWAAPERAVTLVVPFPAGGPSDVIGRAMGRGLATRLGQPVVIDNRTGAGGMVGAALVKAAAPDGGMLLLASNSHVINQTLNPRQTYHALNDFTPIAMVSSGPLVLVVNPDRVKARSFPAFLDELARAPGRFSYGSGGNGTLTHLAPELMKLQRGITAVHVPYRGSAQAMQDVMGGQVDFVMDVTGSALPHVRSGRVLALAVSGSSPVAELPGVPTMGATLPGFDVVSWQAVLGPARMSDAELRRLREAVVASRDASDFAAVIGPLGMSASTVPAGSTQAFLSSELTRWGDVVHKAKITLD